MAEKRYHINPKTGRVNQCNAAQSCPFAPPSQHYANKAEARTAYESNMKSFVVPTAAKKKSTVKAAVSSKISENDKVVFTHGDCHALAYTLYKSSDLPIAVVGLPPSVWTHVLNKLPDGRFIDIEGIHSYEEVWQKWGIEQGLEGEGMNYDDIRILSKKEVVDYGYTLGGAYPEKYEPKQYSEVDRKYFTRIAETLLSEYSIA